MKNFCTIRVSPNSKRLLLLIVLGFFKLSASACEICGCSINGYHFGILPQFQKNYLGLRYSYRSFASQHLISETLGILGGTSTEYFNSVEVWGRFHVGKKVQVMAILPFNHYQQNELGSKSTAQGLGDVTLAANYSLYNSATNPLKTFKQTLLVGGGIKLPTGKFNPAIAGQALNPSINTGTGSVDFLLTAMYTCRYKKVGINTEANYRINTTNQQNFRYGNRVTTSARFFYWQNIGSKASLLPNAGITFEHAGKDTHFTEKQTYSGGNTTHLTAGLESYVGPVNIGITYNHPLQQRMAQGLVKGTDHFSVTVGFSF